MLLKKTENKINKNKRFFLSNKKEIYLRELLFISDNNRISMGIIIVNLEPDKPQENNAASELIYGRIT
tara:strand:+ start:423 stop:626 length:204 start_codon:yes stop_codon:yes gene_type:complete